MTGYYLHNTIAGTEYPFSDTSINPESYNAGENTLAWMVEPKFIYTTYSWQPYFVAGIGVAANSLSGFNQQQISDTAPNGNGWFANKTNTNLAYEFGLGVQHTIYNAQSGGSLILAAEYRYMNLGLMGFGTAASQTSTQGLTLGDLETNMLDASLTWQF